MNLILAGDVGHIVDNFEDDHVRGIEELLFPAAQRQVEVAVLVHGGGRGGNHIGLPDLIVAGVAGVQVHGDERNLAIGMHGTGAAAVEVGLGEKLVAVLLVKEVGILLHSAAAIDGDFRHTVVNGVQLTVEADGLQGAKSGCNQSFIGNLLHGILHAHEFLLIHFLNCCHHNLHSAAALRLVFRGGASVRSFVDKKSIPYSERRVKPFL